MNKSSTTVFVITCSLSTAMILRILPWPREWLIANPDWVLLFIVYWNLALPDRFGVVWAWFTGLLADALTGRMLGQQALAYTLVSYMSLKLHRQLRLAPLFQQSLMLLLFQLFCQVMVFWTQNIKSVNTAAAHYWLPSVVGAALWPAIFLALRWVRRNFSIG